MNGTKLQRLMVAAALLIVGIGIGSAVNTANQAHAETRGAPTPPAFKSGAQLAVPVLNEIAATLQQIDARLARLETVAQKMQSEGGRKR